MLFSTAQRIPLLVPLAEIEGEVPGEGNGWEGDVVEVGLVEVDRTVGGLGRKMELPAPVEAPVPGRGRRPLRYIEGSDRAAGACGDNNKKSKATKGTSAGGKGGTIAVLLPETKTARYEAADRPLMEAKIRELCPDCKILYSNADQDAAKQQQQAEAALTNGAKVMVLDPVDSAAASTIEGVRP